MGAVTNLQSAWLPSLFPLLTDDVDVVMVCFLCGLFLNRSVKQDVVTFALSPFIADLSWLNFLYVKLSEFSLQVKPVNLYILQVADLQQRTCCS